MLKFASFRDTNPLDKDFKDLGIKVDMRSFNCDLAPTLFFHKRLSCSSLESALDINGNPVFTDFTKPFP